MKSWKTIDLVSGNPEDKRAEIKRYFNGTFDLYEELFLTLKNDDAYYERPEVLRHPLIFYFGHTATFFVNKLVTSNLFHDRIDEKVEAMMAIGVDEMSWDDLDHTVYDWPTVEEVRIYRDKVRKMVNGLIDTMALTLPINFEDPFWVIMMGIEHERIHVETSSVLIRQLDMDYIKPLPSWPLCDDVGVAPKNSLLDVPGGVVKLGRSFPSNTYGWDNEYGEMENKVRDFKASKYLVSNEEFLNFVNDKGYETERWWTEEGWKWKNDKKITQPTFWISEENSKSGYQYRALYSIIDLPMNWPVDVNFLEAKAFCNWMTEKSAKPIRLPTEAEWMRFYEESDVEKHITWEKAPGNINLEYFASSVPVDYFMKKGFGDVIGNLWQWTESAIDGFEGFKVHPSYDDFSVPTFDGRHLLIKGGSWASTGNAAEATSRYAFRRHFYQHAGFRYVESDEKVSQEFNIYETDDLIAQYLEFHYGESYFDVPNFPKACISKIIEKVNFDKKDRALDLGCAVGRSSFELARHFEFVDAMDFSTRFIRNALQLREYGSVRYMIPIEGDIMDLKEFKLESLNMEGRSDRIDFTQGDANNLRDKYADYDLVFAGNLIDRLYDPKKFLSEIHSRIREGGYLVLTSPYTWLEEYTDKAKWLGGTKVNGENLATHEGIRKALSSHFDEYCDAEDIPFVIRETARKHQHTVAQMTFWKKR